MRVSLFFAVFLTAVFSFEKVRSQHFEEGYVVTAGNDTLKGFVSQTSDAASFIGFKKSLSDPEAVAFRPPQLNAFYVKQWGEIFVSKVVDLDVKPVKLDELDDNGSSKFIRDTLFLKLLVKGKVSLYQYTDKTNKIHYFFQEGDREAKELLRFKYRKLSDLIVINLYRQQLKERLTGCAADYSRLGFNESELKKAILTYNQCVGSPSAFVQKNVRLKGIPYFMVGILSSKGTYSGAPENINLTSAAKPVYTVGLEIAPTRSGKHFSGGFEVVLKDYRLTGKSFVVSSTYSKTANYFYLSTDMNLFVKYTFNMKIRPYLKAGVMEGLNSERKNGTYYTASGNYVGPLDTFSRLTAGYFAGIGLSYHQLFAEFRYESTTIGSPNASSITTTSLNFQIGYRFRKL
jgi:hypothetical protein